MVENIHFIPVDSDPCNRALAWARMPMFLWLPDEMSLEYIFSAAHALCGAWERVRFSHLGRKSLAVLSRLLLDPAPPCGAARPAGMGHSGRTITGRLWTTHTYRRMPWTSVPPSQFSLPSRMGERPGRERIHHGLVFFFKEVSWAMFLVDGLWIIPTEYHSP